MNWASAELPLGVRRPWEVFQDLEDKLVDIRDRETVGDDEKRYYSELRKELSTNGALVEFLNLPEAVQCAIANVSLHELAAYVRWHAAQDGSAVAASSASQVMRQTSWSSLDDAAKAAWSVENPRGVLSADARWAPLLAEGAPPCGSPAEPRAEGFAADEVPDAAAPPCPVAKTRSKGAAVTPQKMTTMATADSLATPASRPNDLRAKVGRGLHAPSETPLKRPRVTGSRCATPASCRCGRSLETTCQALAAHGTFLQARGPPRFCGACCEALARQRKMRCRPGDVVWARLGACGPLWPALVLCLDFQTADEAQPVGVRLFGERVSTAPWLPEADVLAWSEGPQLDSIKNVDHRRAVALAEAAMNPAAVPRVERTTPAVKAEEQEMGSLGEEYSQLLATTRGLEERIQAFGATEAHTCEEKQALLAEARRLRRRLVARHVETKKR